MIPLKSLPHMQKSAEEVAKLCFDKFKLLPKTGKPNNNEWTVLAAVILHNKQTGKSEVVSLGCGTKCIGKSKLCKEGFILNDSHAEIMARRGLIRYLYNQIHKVCSNEESVFVWVPEQRKFQFKDELSLHFLSTQTPCGDACITATQEPADYIGEPLNKRCKADIKFTNIEVESTKDTVYTGAKLIGGNYSDEMEQIVGAVRTKPGRGERTLSMSCSDKLAKWQIMGVQGVLLDFLLTKPIYFETLIFCGENNLDSLKRAVWKRFDSNEFENSKYKRHVPQIIIVNKPEFPYAQHSTKKPSANGLVWCDIPNTMKPYETSVNGKRQGVTTKKFQSPESALKISKYFLGREFLNVIKLKPDVLPPEDKLELKTYLDCKLLANDYQSAWFNVKKHYFKQWSQKPHDFLKFHVKELDNKDIDAP